jgi:hypothetical protein
MRPVSAREYFYISRSMPQSLVFAVDAQFAAPLMIDVNYSCGLQK